VKALLRRAVLLLAAASVVALAGCSSLGGSLDLGSMVALGQAGQQVQAAEQTEFTPEQEYYIGRAVAANLLTTRKVWDNPAATTYLNTLETYLASVSDKPETFGGYHLLILDTDEINAFGAPGGLILISRGLLRCATSEDMVAAILAHETSHIVLGHGLSAIKESRKTAAYKNLALAGVAAFGSPEARQLTDIFKDTISDITNTLVNSGYSRDLELEADQMALVIMKRAGYDPLAFDAMLKQLGARVKPGGLDFAKTHPDPKVREDAVEKTLGDEAPLAVPAKAAAARQARWKAALGNV
jgi:beta-barrel assembly-enhancing protease